MAKRIQIAVIGGREEPPDILNLAEEAGRRIARAGAVLVCGGLGGVMEAACRGARDAGGITLGILPGGRADDANAYVDVAVPTGMGIARNALVIHASDGVIAVGGSYGTLSEMAFALQKRIPLVSLRSWKPDDTVPVASTADEAVEFILRSIKSSRFKEGTSGVGV